MSETRLVDLVDACDFRGLFIDELGWNNPDQPDRRIDVDQQTYTLTQVADHKGLRIWYCAELPTRKTQRTLDELIGRDSHERLVIFADDDRQEWRWPRRAQTGGANAKLLAHQHTVGESDPHLIRQLEAIAIDFDVDLSLVELLSRMRQAFDVVAETASVEAARLMGTLYNELDKSRVPPHDATLLLARLLFLLFGDDTGMWEARLFQRYVAEYTTDDTLHTDLDGLFRTLNTLEAKRTLPPGSPYEPFRYVNGGLYADPLSIPSLSAEFRAGLLSAGDFDWGVISPAVFGSMFQTVKDKNARRQGGEHYTTEANILKTIRPLFLDEYQERLDAGWDDKAQLTKLHNDLGRLRFLDPACGCGNFLIVAYRELRSLELELLKRRRDLDILNGVHTGGVDRSQMSLDVTGDIKVTLDHFYGIEIEEWPARIAETAMLLVDHLANQRMEQDFGLAPDRLPIAIAPTIHHGNALHTDWANLVPSGDHVIVMGNPPFNGARTLTPGGRADMEHVWGPALNGNFDFVTAWYRKALDYFGNEAGRWAFVSTNSICQGEPAADLWQAILNEGWRCRFAHRSFQWDSEAVGKAAVHVSILGFDRAKTSPKPALWTYEVGGGGEGVRNDVTRINPYLVDGPNVLVRRRPRPLRADLPPISNGSMANDGGHLFVAAAELDKTRADPAAAKYLRRFVGADELIHDLERWCLWMTNLDPLDVAASAPLRERLAAVRKLRTASRRVGTKKAAHVPHLFGERRQPDVPYLAIPRHVSEHRRYFTVAHLSPEIICGDANFLVPDPDGFVLGILSSSMFIAWMRAIGGRLESRLRFSNTFTYNTFPFPSLTARQKTQIVAAASGIISAREAHPGASLATLYETGSMPNDLAKAHKALDQVVDNIFEVNGADEAGCATRT
ncbi:MAG TPA: DNA methyltransferase [Aeromicrobium sp.]|nr:DNA methyltransferase [Aeromicrobium sp.]